MTTDPSAQELTASFPSMGSGNLTFELIFEVLKSSVQNPLGGEFVKCCEKCKKCVNILKRKVNESPVKVSKP